jgi:hypothetical protein
LEKQNEELRVMLAELEAVQKSKMKATTVASKNEDKVEVTWLVSCWRVQIVAAAAPDGRDCETLRRSSWPVTE